MMVLSPYPRPLINWGHPLSRGLRAAWVPAAGIAQDLVGGVELSFAGTAAFNSPTGSLRCDAADEGLSITIPAQLQLATYPISIVAYFQIIGTPSTFTTIFGVTANNSDTSPYMLYGFTFADTPVLGAGFRSWCTPGVGGATFVGSAETAALGLYQLVGTIVGGSQAFYINAGVPNTAVNGFTDTITYSGTGQIAFGDHTGVSRNPNLDLFYGLIYDRLLTREEVNWLYVEPYAFLQPPFPAQLQLNIVAAGLTMPMAMHSYRQRRGYA